MAYIRSMCRKQSSWDYKMNFWMLLKEVRVQLHQCMVMHEVTDRVLDLHRTFPDNIRFKSTAPRTSNSHSYDDVPAIQALRRILSAFSVYSPNIGYCQSLNYIAGFLLLFMNEEEAFWTFVTAIHDILPPSVYDVTMEGANIDQTVLMMLLSERCPQIWNRLGGGRSFWECEQAEANGLPTTSLVTSHWFLTLFINILPTEVSITSAKKVRCTVISKDYLL